MSARQTSLPEAPTSSRAHHAASRPPVTRTESVVRTALVNRLRASGAPLVTVTAPAGYGKTTLLAQWEARDERPFAWVRLDDDTDPRVLVRNLAVALDQRPIVLVLDDAHLLRSRRSLSVVAALAEQMPDRSTLVLAGRSVRLAVARTRAAGRLFELDLDDLALSGREEELLLRDAGIALAPDDRLALRQRMEGWAAGTYLAALALREGAHAAGSGEDRFLADYFDFECTSGLPAKDLRFLMRAAVLERLSGPLCDHVLDVDGSATRLETLARANLFVLPLDRERGWYRFHHAFREYLLAELRRREPDAIPDLNRRAAVWCEAAGEVSAAAAYAHASGDLDGVARLVTLDGLTAATARSATGERWLGWFDRPERLRAHPDIAVLGAWAHLVKGRPADARRWRNAAVAAAEDALESELAVLRAARCEGGVEQMRADARTALAGLGPVSPWQPLARLLRGVAELLLGEDARAEEMLGDAAECAESAGEPELQAWALSELALLAWARGEETRADELAVAACALVEGRQPADDPSSALALALSARLHVRRGRTRAARLDLERADSLVRQLTAALPWYAAQTTLELVRLELALADPAAARRRLDGATAVPARRPRLGVLAGQAADLADETRALAARRDARQSGLTTAELRLLPLLTTHLSFREIAEELYVSRNTVKTQAISVYRKLNASSRSEAIARARDLGLVDASSPRVEFTPSG